MDGAQLVGVMKARKKTLLLLVLLWKTRKYLRNIVTLPFSNKLENLFSLTASPNLYASIFPIQNSPAEIRPPSSLYCLVWWNRSLGTSFNSSTLKHWLTSPTVLLLSCATKPRSFCQDVDVHVDTHEWRWMTGHLDEWTLLFLKILPPSLTTNIMSLAQMYGACGNSNKLIITLNTNFHDTTITQYSTAIIKRHCDLIGLDRTSSTNTSVFF